LSIIFSDGNQVFYLPNSSFVPSELSGQPKLFHLALLSFGAIQIPFGPVILLIEPRFDFRSVLTFQNPFLVLSAMGQPVSF
jgi:hypothetical protein